jgi:hypothetical protein
VLCAAFTMESPKTFAKPVGDSVGLRKSISQRVIFQNEDAVEEGYIGASEVIWAKENGSPEAVTVAFDKLLDSLLTNFKDRVTPRDIRSAVPHRRPHGPDLVEQSVFPVALVSELLTRRKVRINTRRLKNWPAFTQRYGAALMAA